MTTVIPSSGAFEAFLELKIRIKSSFVCVFFLLSLFKATFKKGQSRASPIPRQIIQLLIHERERQ